jgi:hypothetical protein
MPPDPSHLLDSLGLETPPIGLYDAPDAAAFEPCLRPEPGRHTCVFAFYKDWLRGRTLHLTWEAHGCGGAGPCLFGRHERPPEDLVTFLVEEEGLKRSRETMLRWVERRRMHLPAHPNILIGPLRPDQDAYLKSVTFFVDPDRLGALVVGANYDAGPDDPVVVTAPFGSGCMQLLGPADSGDEARAYIGGTDAAMRRYLPADTLAFTVNRVLFARLCALDERSFLHKPFWTGLQAARGRA